MDTITGAGSMIGFLERLIIGACLVYSQFSYRTGALHSCYNKISENPAFAEYYLIGSLVHYPISPLCCLVVSIRKIIDGLRQEGKPSLSFTYFWYNGPSKKIRKTVGV